MFRIRLIIQGINRGKLFFGDEWKTHGFDSSFSYWLNFLCQIIHTLFIGWSEFLMRICETSFYGILCCWSKESLGTVSLTADKTAFLSWLNIRRKLDDAYADLDKSISLLIDRNQLILLKRTPFSLFCHYSSNHLYERSKCIDVLHVELFDYK